MTSRRREVSPEKSRAELQDAKNIQAERDALAGKPSKKTGRPLPLMTQAEANAIFGSSSLDTVIAPMPSPKRKPKA